MPIAELNIQSLPEELQRFREQAADLVNIFGRYGFYGSVLATQNQGRGVTLRGRWGTGEVKTTTDAAPYRSNSGVRITVYDGNTLHSLASTELDPNILRGRIINLCEAVTQQEGPQVEDPNKYLNKHFETPMVEDPTQVTLDEILDRNNHVLRVLMQDQRVRADVRFTEDIAHRVFADPHQLLSQTLRDVQLRDIVYATMDGVARVNHDFVCGSDYTQIRRVEDEAFHQLRDETIEFLDSKQLQPGMYTVVIGPQPAGLFAHESFGHGYEADKVAQGLAAAGQHINKRVGSNCCSIADTPGLPYFGVMSTSSGKHFFDDEGVLTTDEPTILVKNGILQPTPLTDFSSFLALRDKIEGIKRTPNGRLERFGHDIYARMTQTYFMPDPVNGLEFEAMIADIQDGIYLAHGQFGMEDPMGWGIQVGGLVGYRIKDGKLTREVYCNLAATGYVPDFLRSIDAVGTELSLSPGYCGKGKKELVPVATGGTFLRARVHLS